VSSRIEKIMTPEKQGEIAEKRSEQSREEEQTRDRDQSRNDQVLVPLHAEEVSVAKRRVVTGRVKVSTVTRQHEQLIEEMLERDHVEVERIPVDREVDKPPPVREEGDTLIVPIVEEIVVVERRLRLKEEVRIRRTRETQPYKERVVVRKQEAVITRL
jgi:stress response protein YsnF